MKKSLSIGVALAASAALAGGLASTQAQADSPAKSVKNVAVGAPSTAPEGTSAQLARVFAVVNADGSSVRGKGFTSLLKLGTGVYDVRFNRSIASCGWVGTVGLGTFSGSTGPAMITITGRAGTNNGLFVTTFNAAGVATDLPFTTDVICS